MKIGIYSPYLDTCGGGEKYVGKIAEVLAEENQVEFLVEREPKIEELKNRSDLSPVKICARPQISDLMQRLEEYRSIVRI